MRNGTFPIGLIENANIRTGRNACPTNTTTPHEVNCMAQWGEKTGKLRIQIIVGSGA